MRVRNFLSLIIILSSISFSVTNIVGCTEINTPDQYVLPGSIISDSTTSCINITVSDVELDCTGSSILATGISQYPAILVYNSSSSLSNITIKNCNIKDFESSISIQNSSDTNVTNLNISSSSTLVDLGGPALLINDSSNVIISGINTIGYNLSIFTLSSSFVNLTSISTQWSSSGNSSSSISIGINQSSDVLVVDLNSSNRHIGIESYDSVRITAVNSSIYVPDAVNNCGDIYLNNVNQSIFTNISGTRTFNGFYGVNMSNSNENIFTQFNLSGNGGTAFELRNSSSINMSILNLADFTFGFDIQNSSIVAVSNSNASNISYVLFNLSNTSHNSFDNISLEYNNTHNTIVIQNLDSFNNSFNSFTIDGDTDNYQFMNNTNSNLTTLNNSVFGYGCALISNSYQVQISNVTYQKSGLNTCGYLSSGIRLYNSHQINLSNLNSTQNANQYALSVSGSSDLNLISSTFFGSSDRLIYLNDSSNLFFDSIFIDDGAISAFNLSNINMTYSNLSINNANNINAFFCDQCTYSLISNSIFNSSNSTYQIYFINSLNSSISNSNISNSDGLSIIYSNNTSITDNSFYNSSQGISLDSDSDTLISSNLFYDLNSSISATVINFHYLNLTIQSNSFYNLTCTSYCFYIYGYENVNFTNNNYSLAGHGVYFNSISYLNLNSNNIFNVSSIAITLSSSRSNEIIENNNVSNSLFAIQIEDSNSFVHILSNNISDNWVGGINVITAEANLSNNTFSNNNPTSSNASVLGLSGIQAILFGESPLADVSSLGSLIIADNNTMFGGLTGFMSISSLISSSNNIIYNKSGEVIYSRISNVSSSFDHYYNSSNAAFTNSSTLFFDTGIEVSGYFYDPSDNPISNKTYLSLVPASGSPVSIEFNGSSTYSANTTHINVTSSNISDSNFSQDYQYVEGSLINHTFYFNVSALAPSLDYTVTYLSNDGESSLARNVTIVLTNTTSTYVYNYSLPEGYYPILFANSTLLNFSYSIGSGYTEFASFENYDPLTSINMTVSFALPQNVTYTFGQDPTFLSFTNLILDGSSDGVLSSYNYTNISFTDVMQSEENSSYRISWSSLSDGPSTPYSSLSNQSFNISSLGMFSPNIDQINIHWLDVQIAGLNESVFNLHRSTGTAWYANNINQSLDVSSNLLNISNLSIFGQFSVLEGLSLSSSSPTCTNCGSNHENRPQTISVSLVSSCNQNNLTTNPSEVRVSVIDDSGSFLYEGTTDSNGKASFVGCGGNVKVYSNKDGYTSSTEAFHLNSCSCMSPPVQNETLPVIPPQLPQPPAPPVLQPVISPEPDMQVTYGVFVGDPVSVLFISCESCILRVTNPLGQTNQLSADSSNRVNFNTDTSGNYQLDLVNNSQVVKSASFIARSRPMSQQTEMPQSPPSFDGIAAISFVILILALLAILLFLLFRRRSHS